jgi:hypothetical protein
MTAPAGFERFVAEVAEPAQTLTLPPSAVAAPEVDRFVRASHKMVTNTRRSNRPQAMWFRGCGDRQLMHLLRHGSAKDHGPAGAPLGDAPKRLSLLSNAATYGALSG